MSNIYFYIGRRFYVGFIHAFIANKRLCQCIQSITLLLKMNLKSLILFIKTSKTYPLNLCRAFIILECITSKRTFSTFGLVGIVSELNPCRNSPITCSILPSIRGFSNCHWNLDKHKIIL